MKLAFARYDYGASHVSRGWRDSAVRLRAELDAMLGASVVDVPAGEGHQRMHLHFCPAPMFRPSGRFDALFTMFEETYFPAQATRAYMAASAIFVPSRWCASVLAQVGLRTYLIPLAASAEVLAADPYRRIIRGSHDPLRVLWVGSKTDRKGWHQIAPMWETAGLRHSLEAKLTIKTAGDDGDIESVSTNGNVTLDKRDISPPDMATLYAETDIFVSTSLSEGFGLCPLEAMAAGAVAILPATTASVDIGSLGKRTTAVLVRPDSVAPIIFPDEKKFTMAAASGQAIGLALRHVIDSWSQKETQAIRQAGVDEARKLTWTRTALAVCRSLDDAHERRSGTLSAASASPTA